MAADVERLPGPVKLVGEVRLQELAARAAGAVEGHHRIVDPPVGAPARRAQRQVMHAQFGQRLAVLEAEIAEDDVALGAAR